MSFLKKLQNPFWCSLKCSFKPYCLSLRCKKVYPCKLRTRGDSPIASFFNLWSGLQSLLSFFGLANKWSGQKKSPCHRAFAMDEFLRTQHAKAANCAMFVANICACENSLVGDHPLKCFGKTKPHSSPCTCAVNKQHRIISKQCKNTIFSILLIFSIFCGNFKDIICVIYINMIKAIIKCYDF